CKSIARTYDLYTGDPKALRSAKTNHERDIAKWTSVVHRLREAPIGDNYDLSSYRKITGVVCTSMPVLCEAGLTVEPNGWETSWTVSLLELYQLLRREHRS